MGANTEPGGGLDQAVIHDVLRNERRRLTLERLYEANAPVDVGDLAEYLATAECGETPAPRNLRQSAYVSLHQTHLPKLHDLDIVEYDKGAKRVTLAEHASAVTVYLEVVPRYGLTRSELFVGLSLFGLLLGVASAVGVPGFSSISPGTWTAAGLAGVGLIAAYYTARQEGSLSERFR